MGDHRREPRHHLPASRGGSRPHLPFAVSATGRKWGLTPPRAAVADGGKALPLLAARR